MMSQAGQSGWTKIIAIHILPNILRGKGNQTMYFSQLIRYNMRNIFLEKSYTLCGGQSSSRPFYKKVTIKCIHFKKFCFIVCPNRILPKYIKTKVLTTYYCLM